VRRARVDVLKEPSGTYSPEYLEKLFGKSSDTSQTSHHQTNHSYVDERFSGCT
jgi:hypothetical protein